MTTAIEKRPAPRPVQLLYNPLAWIQLIRHKAERMKERHTEWNLSSVAGHIQRGARVLDIGAWDGRFGRALHDRLDCQVLNVDVVDKNTSGLPFRLFDGKRLPVGDDERFDAVTIMYVLHHSADDLAILREARRVCAGDGVVVIAEDQVETAWQRVVTIGFHVWLLACTGMGWRGKFRRVEAWRARLAEAGLRLDEVIPLGSHMGKRAWPHNVIFLARPA